MAANREKFLQLVKDKSAKHNIDWRLVDAIVQIESNYDMYAARFEIKSAHCVIPDKFAKINLTTIATEEVLQKFSWGLCQIMGSTARWLGFQGPIPFLCDPDINLTLACRYLAKLKEDHGVLEHIVASYNAGNVRRTSDGKLINQEYVDRVLKIYHMPHI